MLGVGSRVKLRGVSLELLIVDIITYRLVTVAWKTESGRVYELIVAKATLESVNA